MTEMTAAENSDVMNYGKMNNVGRATPFDYAHDMLCTTYAMGSTLNDLTAFDADAATW